MASRKIEPIGLDDAKELVDFMLDRGVQQFKIGDLHVTFGQPPKDETREPKPETPRGET